MSDSRAIGSIRLIEHLGEGGMGTVWVGFDDKLQREVAVKTIRSDRLDLESRARFLTEARLLSQLEHPNICRLYDYLDTDQGDFLILERIHGKTLAELDPATLDRRTKLAIVRQIASALNAAHARGIVHRDLKTANVMLADDGVVKVLDFGLARLVGEPISTSRTDSASNISTSPNSRVSEEAPRDRGTMTRFGSLLLRGEGGVVAGTPRSMSPEQAQGATLSPASDLYSLSLLMQELFTGRPPYPQGLSRQEVLDRAVVGDTEPLTLADRDLRALITSLRSTDVELRPTAKEVTSRVRRIQQRPQRRRRWLLAAALAFVALTAILKHNQDLRSERNLAVAARAEAEEVSDFLISLFEASSPFVARGEEVSARRLLDLGAERIDGQLSDQPDLQLKLQDTIAKVYHVMGLHEIARPRLERLLERSRQRWGDDHLEVARSQLPLAASLAATGELDRTEQLLSQALAVFRRELGAHLETARALSELGLLRREAGQLVEAETLLREALDMRRQLTNADDSTVAVGLHNLAAVLGDLGQMEQAVSLQRQALDIRRRTSGADPNLAASLNDLASRLQTLGEFDEAEALLREALTLRRQALGEADGRVGDSLNNLAALLDDRGDLNGAEPLYERAIEVWRQALGSNHHKIGIGFNNLSHLRQRLGDLKGADLAMNEAIRIIRTALGTDHFLTGVLLANQAKLRLDQRRPEEAEDLVADALTILQGALPEGHWRILSADSIRGATWLAQGRVLAARPVLEHSYSELFEQLGGDSRYAREALGRLVDCYDQLGESQLAAEHRMLHQATNPAS